MPRRPIQTVHSMLHDDAAFQPPKELFVPNLLHTRPIPYELCAASTFKKKYICITLAHWHGERVTPIITKGKLRTENLFWLSSDSRAENHISNSQHNPEEMGSNLWDCLKEQDCHLMVACRHYCHTKVRNRDMKAIKLSLALVLS